MEIVKEHLKELKKYLGIWKRYKARFKSKDFLESVDVQNMVLHSMFVSIQAAIDLANDIIVMKNLEEPSTYRETFEILAKNHIITAKLASRLMSLVGFRNVIAHVYYKLDVKRAYKVFRKGDGVLETFLRKTSELLHAHAGSFLIHREDLPRNNFLIGNCSE